MKQTTFNGFNQQALTFLQQVRSENSKPWFEEHRQIYQDNLLAPFRALVDVLAGPMLVIDPQFEVRPAVGKTLSRIHRDTRFSHDKSLYRSQMWLTFKRPSKQWTDAPVFFFELTPDTLRYGLGYYCASKATMDRFRHLTLQQPQVFVNAIVCCKSPFELVGDSYKRPLIKGQDAALADWYNRKSFAVIATDQHMEHAFSASLIATLHHGFASLVPLYQFLMQVETLKQVPLEDL